MPVNILQLLAGDLGADYCFTTYQRLNVDIVSRIQAVLTTSIATYWNVGAATPSAENRIYPWFNTQDGNVYFWNQAFAYWTAKPRVPPGPNGLREEWSGSPIDGSPAGLWRFDGGDGTDPTVAGNVTPISGSFWTVDTNFEARMGIGPGTLPSGQVIQDGTVGGEEKHTLILAELPNVSLSVPLKIGQTSPQDPGSTFLANPASSLSDFDLSIPLGGSSDPHNNMPPYRGIYKIKRTSRAWLAIPG